MISVELKKKPVSGVRYSLYLDFSPKVLSLETGKLIRYKTLGLYIYIDPQNDKEWLHNYKTMASASDLKSNFLSDLLNRQSKSSVYSTKDGNFLSFIEELRNLKKGSNKSNWNSLIIYLKKFAGEHISFSQIDAVFCREFAAYLKSQPALGKRRQPISASTASNYFAKFKLALKQAYMRRFLHFYLSR